MTYTAKLTGNKRDTRYVPKCLLLEIVDETGTLFRDHCWVQLTALIAKIQPKGHKYPVRVQFTAQELHYLSSEGNKVTLEKIRNLTVI